MCFSFFIGKTSFGNAFVPLVIPLFAFIVCRFAVTCQLQYIRLALHFITILSRSNCYNTLIKLNLVIGSIEVVVVVSCSFSFSSFIWDFYIRPCILFVDDVWLQYLWSVFEFRRIQEIC